MVERQLDRLWYRDGLGGAHHRRGGFGQTHHHVHHLHNVIWHEMRWHLILYIMSQKGNWRAACSRVGVSVFQKANVFTRSHIIWPRHRKGCSDSVAVSFHAGKGIALGSRPLRVWLAPNRDSERNLISGAKAFSHSVTLPCTGKGPIRLVLWISRRRQEDARRGNHAAF